jgi:hypothetical protein
MKIATAKRSEKRDSDKAFAALLDDAMHGMWPDWTVDEMLLHPAEAHAFCVQVRIQSKSQRSDHEILRALLNARKRSLLKSRGRRGRYECGRGRPPGIEEPLG